MKMISLKRMPLESKKTKIQLKDKLCLYSLICIAPISNDNYLGSVILLPSISIAPIWIASVWDDTE